MLMLTMSIFNSGNSWKSDLQSISQRENVKLNNERDLFFQSRG